MAGVSPSGWMEKVWILLKEAAPRQLEMLYGALVAPPSVPPGGCIDMTVDGRW
jgi:hypothetical protein